MKKIVDKMTLQVKALREWTEWDTVLRAIIAVIAVVVFAYVEYFRLYDTEFRCILRALVLIALGCCLWWKQAKENKLLLSTLIVFGLLVTLRLLPSLPSGKWGVFSASYQYVSQSLGLNYYQLLIFTGALFAVLWTNKHYRHSQKRYDQANDAIFLNQVNIIYLEVVKLFSNDAVEEDKTRRNMVRSLQTSIDLYCSDNAKKAKELRTRLLNFSRMSLVELNSTHSDFRGVNLSSSILSCAQLNGSHLQDANLHSTALPSANLCGSDLCGANLNSALLRSADLRNTNLSGADFTESCLNRAKIDVDSFKSLEEKTLHTIASAQGLILSDKFRDLNADYTTVPLDETSVESLGLHSYHKEFLLKNEAVIEENYLTWLRDNLPSQSFPSDNFLEG